MFFSVLLKFLRNLISIAWIFTFFCRRSLRWEKIVVRRRCRVRRSRRLCWSHSHWKWHEQQFRWWLFGKMQARKCWRVVHYRATTRKLRKHLDCCACKLFFTASTTCVRGRKRAGEWTLLPKCRRLTANATSIVLGAIEIKIAILNLTLQTRRSARCKEDGGCRVRQTTEFGRNRVRKSVRNIKRVDWNSPYSKVNGIDGSKINPTCSDARTYPATVS